MTRVCPQALLTSAGSKSGGAPVQYLVSSLAVQTPDGKLLPLNLASSGGGGTKMAAAAHVTTPGAILVTSSALTSPAAASAAPRNAR